MKSLSQIAASLTTTFRRRRDEAVAYTKTLPVRVEVAAVKAAVAVGEVAINLAARVHAATTEKRQETWRRHLRDLRQRVRVKELSLTIAKQSSCRVDVSKKGVATVRSSGLDFQAAMQKLEAARKAQTSISVEDLAEATSVSVESIRSYMDDTPVSDKN